MIAQPLCLVAIFAASLHLGVLLDLLPRPRPTLDVDRTILIHQAEACLEPDPADLLLLGDSSCLMDVSARQLGAELGRSVLNLGTLSYLDLGAFGTLAADFIQNHPGQVRTVILLMHPEALRRPAAESYYLGVLDQVRDGKDRCRTESLGGRLSCLLGIEVFKGRIESRILPAALEGAFGRTYGFNRDLERSMDRDRGSATDPQNLPLTGNPEYRLAATLKDSSRALRRILGRDRKLYVGITPLPRLFAGPEYPTKRDALLREWASWLEADAALLELPAVLDDEQFARTTHLKPSAVPGFTRELARIVSGK